MCPRNAFTEIPRYVAASESAIFFGGSRRMCSARSRSYDAMLVSVLCILDFIMDLSLTP